MNSDIDHMVYGIYSGMRVCGIHSGICVREYTPFMVFEATYGIRRVREHTAYGA